MADANTNNDVVIEEIKKILEELEKVGNHSLPIGVKPPEVTVSMRDNTQAKIKITRKQDNRLIIKISKKTIMSSKEIVHNWIIGVFLFLLLAFLVTIGFRLWKLPQASTNTGNDIKSTSID